MEEILLDIVSTINSYFSNYILIALLVGVGIFYTVRTRFVQVRCFGEGFRRVFGRQKAAAGNKGGLSSFQALATAIAAQVGTGNIVGACGAILIGGPGAIFWMWIIAFFGMATIYAEATLAQSTREVGADGAIHGGPVYYIKAAFRGKFGKFLAAFFAVAAMLALGFIGSMVQSNSITESFGNVLGTADYSWLIGLIVTAIAAFIFLGGIKRIASVCEKMVPIMASLYLVGALFVIIVNITNLPAAIAAIFKYAFLPNAIIGGSIGYAIKEAISQGAKRGLFSNEAGMGSTPHAHAVAEVEKPHDQGVAAMIGVFIDTFVVLTATALVVIITLYCGNGPLVDGLQSGEMFHGVAIAKTSLAQLAFGDAFSVVFGEAGYAIGNIFVAACLFFFAFSTIIGWNFFGKVNVEYLFGKIGVKVYSVLALGFIFLGSCFKNDLVWELTDFFNYLMVLPNVIALFTLSAMVVSAVKSAKKANPLNLDK